MAYRAPELYDVQPGKQLDEKVDVWVLSDGFAANVIYLKLIP